MRKVGEVVVALMLYLDDAMKVLLQNDFIDIGYIDEDGSSEIVRSKLEQKCYLREPVDIVRCKDCKHKEESVSPSWEAWCNRLHCGCDNDWFCADGERK